MRLLGFLAFVIGAALPLGILDDGLRMLLITLFGLLSAGFIPAMSLLVSANYPSSYSVARIKAIDDELGLLLERMKATLGLNLAGAVLVLVSQAGLPSPTLSVTLPHLGVVDLQSWPERVLAGGVMACFAISLDRLRLYVAAFRKVRALRLDLALEEARDRLRLQAPAGSDVSAMFPKSQVHGTIVKVTAGPP